MFHYEGGWPDNVDITDNQDKKKHIKKKLEKTVDNQDKFTPAVKRVVESVEEIIDKNNQIDMFEEYFTGEEPEHNIEKLSIKTLMLFKDQNNGVKRGVSRLCWHPDGPYSIAAGYSCSRFQQQSLNMLNEAYIWDLNNPNVPKETCLPPSPITTLAYNHKNVDQIAFGCYNGLVGVWDVRSNKKAPEFLSEVENSHHEPVVDLIWLSSKGGNEFVTCSTDGRVNWWDYKNLSQPTDSVLVSEMAPDKDVPLKERFDETIGSTCIEYVPDFGPKYLMGTEKGSIMLATKKPKKNCEINFNTSYGIELGRHLGPVYSIQRNPVFPRFFMSVGDWSVNVWEEEEKTPIIKTRYHPSYLTDGCWAPNRPGLFFVTRRDGWLDIWDYFYRQNEVALSHKVADASLTCMKLNNVTGAGQVGVQHMNVGKYAAIGDSDGTITLLELCSSLYDVQPKEKDVIEEIFKREKAKESALKKQRIAQDKKKNEGNKDAELAKKKQAAEDDKVKRDNMVSKADSDFHNLVAKTKEEMGDVLNDDNEQENDDEPVKKAMQESDYNEDDDQGDEQQEDDQQEEGEENQEGGEGDDDAVKAKAEELCGLLCKVEDDGVKKGYFENKQHVGDEKDDSHYVEIVYNEEGSFTWKSKAGKEWGLNVNLDQNTFGVTDCPYEDLQEVEMVMDGDAVTGLKGPYEEVWELVEEWSA